MRVALVALAIAVLQLVRGLPPSQDQLFSLFGVYLESLRAQAGIPGLSAAIVGTGDIVWERALGYQDLERSIAARTDTPYQADGLTQLLTTALVLRCAEEGHLTLEDRVAGTTPEAGASIGELLSHTSGAPGNAVFLYRPERLEPLKATVKTCTGDSFRETLANWLERLGMVDSVPGLDAIRLEPPAEGIPDQAAVERYTRVLDRLAAPYAVDARGRASRSAYTVTTLTPSGGLISTVRDLARFDVALRSGVLLRPETLAAAWRPLAGRDGLPLPHAVGGFVQSYNGETVVWQFGVSENASSSLMATIPGRGFTLILLANSTGLVKPFDLAAGDLTVSPFGRTFLRTFVR